ncbi:hypothetical protein CEXT_2441, partial [Caerostris extrusa]
TYKIGVDWQSGILKLNCSVLAPIALCSNCCILLPTNPTRNQACCVTLKLHHTTASRSLWFYKNQVKSFNPSNWLSLTSQGHPAKPFAPYCAFELHSSST